MAQVGTHIDPLGAIIWHDHEAKSALLIPKCHFIEVEATLVLRRQNSPTLQAKPTLYVGTYCTE